MDDSLETLLQRALQARTEHRPLDARRDLVAAVETSHKDGIPADSARALAALGQIERDLGDSANALRLYEEVAAIHRAEGNALRLAHTVRHVADIHRHEHRFDLAEPCYHQALDIYRGNAETPPLDLANAIRGLALLKTETGAIEEAQRLWMEARDLYKAVNVAAGVEESTRRLADLAK